MSLPYTDVVDDNCRNVDTTVLKLCLTNDVTSENPFYYLFISFHHYLCISFLVSEEYYPPYIIKFRLPDETFTFHHTPMRIVINRTLDSVNVEECFNPNLPI